ncbi:MAG: hypothetical protein GY820_47115 [Gammaproteobacteria bacterium]|nr:hypothetical protein [Gammaproteobacteria bacterium]
MDLPKSPNLDHRCSSLIGPIWKIPKRAIRYCPGLQHIQSSSKSDRQKLRYADFVLESSG